MYSLPANLLSEPILTFLVAPAAIAAAVMAPFGFAEPALQLMASGLDLIAAIGQTFGERPEAVRALPRPPDSALVLCVIALLWACLWRGALRWAGVLFFAASVWVYAAAPRPIAAFDADMRVTYAQAEQGGGAAWTLIARGAGSTYAQERLGAMLGLAPSETERLAPPEACGEHLCAWTLNGRAFALVQAEEGFAAACQPGALVISRLAAPEGYARSCSLLAVIDEPDISQRGGALIYDTPAGLQILRARPPEVRRAWTPRGVAQE